MQVIDNLVVGCPKGVFFSFGEGNGADGNLYAGGSETWRIDDRGGECDFEAWRGAGFDEHGARVVGEVEPAADGIRLVVDLAVLPDSERVRGPFPDAVWETLVRSGHCVAATVTPVG